jgi:uncharacterized protein (TIGR03083 family)
MTSMTDRTIAGLRTNHDLLAGLVPGLSEDQLGGGSGASEWSVAQVLSHLGSGAEIALAVVEAAVSGLDARGENFNQQVWDRWNAKSASEQASGFVESNEQLVIALESLSTEQRETLPINMGFLPFPLSVASFAGMRLNEATQHSWDVRVALDASADLPSEEAQLVAEHLSGDLGFLLGFLGKPEALATPTTVEIQGSGFGLVVDDGVRLAENVADATATFVGPLESAIRLVAGRLSAPHVPTRVTVTGNVSLDDLRRVFPGF